MHHWLGGCSRSFSISFYVLICMYLPTFCFVLSLCFPSISFAASLFLSVYMYVCLRLCLSFSLWNIKTPHWHESNYLTFELHDKSTSSRIRLKARDCDDRSKPNLTQSSHFNGEYKFLPSIHPSFVHSILNSLIPLYIPSFLNSFLSKTNKAPIYSQRFSFIASNDGSCVNQLKKISLSLSLYLMTCRRRRDQ